MTLIIKRLTIDDATCFRALRLEALTLHPESFGASRANEAAHPLSFFENRIANTYILGAFHNETLVGIAGLRSDDSDKTGHIATIFSVYVQENARGLGIARKLMLDLLAAAESYRSIRLSVTSGNDAALALYTSLSFKRWATDIQSLKIGDKFYDEILMRRDR